MKLIKNNVYFCGVQDPHRRLFDELIPLPDGTTYNSYLVKGSEKTALIDTSYSTKVVEFLECLEGESKIDCIIANHGEGDHTDALKFVLEKYPKALIYCTQKCCDILVDAHEIPLEKFHVIADGEKLSLGDKTLQFTIAPWVHWPDTMFTYVEEDKILFTCDFLGAHSIVNEVFVTPSEEYLQGARRYYGEIMMPFRTQCKNYIQKIEALKPEIICPSHGGVYDKPEFILEAYKEWTGDIPKNKVVIPYVSMYGNTEKAIVYLEEKLTKLGVKVDKFDLVKDDAGEYVCSLVDAATIIFAAPMVLAGPHPAAMSGLILTNALRPNIKFMGTINSFGWGGDFMGKVKANLNLQVEMFDPIAFKGKAKAKDKEQIEALAELIAQKHKEIGARN